MYSRDIWAGLAAQECQLARELPAPMFIFSIRNGSLDPIPLQIWVYGNSFESSLVAVVVPLHGKLQVSCSLGIGWLGAGWHWAGLRRGRQVLNVAHMCWRAVGRSRCQRHCTPLTPTCPRLAPLQSLAEEVGVSGTDEQLCHNPKVRLGLGWGFAAGVVGCVCVVLSRQAWPICRQPATPK